MSEVGKLIMGAQWISIEIKLCFSTPYSVSKSRVYTVYSFVAKYLSTSKWPLIVGYDFIEVSYFEKNFLNYNTEKQDECQIQFHYNGSLYIYIQKYMYIF